jgi:hypothetical protein
MNSETAFEQAELWRVSWRLPNDLNLYWWAGDFPSSLALAQTLLSNGRPTVLYAPGEPSVWYEGESLRVLTTNNTN